MKDDVLQRSWHDDVTKWKHFPRYWSFVRGIHRSPVNSPHKGQWRGALMFTLICARINGWVNNREAGDLRRNRAHYDVIVINKVTFITAATCHKNTTMCECTFSVKWLPWRQILILTHSVLLWGSNFHVRCFPHNGNRCFCRYKFARDTSAAQHPVRQRYAG